MILFSPACMFLIGQSLDKFIEDDCAVVRDERDTIGWICWMSTGLMSNIDGSFLSCPFHLGCVFLYTVSWLFLFLFLYFISVG